MVRLVLLVAAILLAVGPGCSGGGGKGDALVGDAEKDERTEPDPGSGDIPGRVDLPRPADLDIAADLGAETDAGTGQELVVPPELGEETGQSPEGLSPEMLALLCDELVCGNFQECFGTEAPADCAAKCKDEAFVGGDYARKLLCALHSGLPPCQAMSECTGYPAWDQCDEVCKGVQACEAQGNPVLGWNWTDCFLLCSLGVSQYPGVEKEFVDCLLAALETCCGPEFISCDLGGSGQGMKVPCEDLFCMEQPLEACSLVPEPFATLDECRAECKDWCKGQELAASLCAEVSAKSSAPCTEWMQGCMKPPPELPEGLVEVCKAGREKCPDGFPFGGDMGKLGYEICAWQMVGFGLVAPGLLKPPGKALECIEGLAVCPQGAIESMYCVLDIPAKYEPMCDEAAKLCVETGDPVQVAYKCNAMLTMAGALNPDFIGNMEQCLTQVSDCDGLLSQCLKGGPE